MKGLLLSFLLIDSWTWICSSYSSMEIRWIISRMSSDKLDYQSTCFSNAFFKNEDNWSNVAVIVILFTSYRFTWSYEQLFFTSGNSSLCSYFDILQLSNLSELHSLRIFMYDLVKTVENGNDQVIAKAVSNFADFGFCFRHKHGLPGEDAIFPVFDDHRQFIKQLCHYTLLSSPNN